MPAVGLCCKPDKFSPYPPNLCLDAGAIEAHLRMLMGEGSITGKIKTGTQTGFSLVHKLVCPVCNIFCWVLPKPLYHTLLHIFIAYEYVAY